ncbi:cox cluster protein [Halobacteriales archaeon QH_10_70_21]|nr:MAG: cox cluster protein [Halobacteriales archaeon QH_10_70_21]
MEAESEPGPGPGVSDRYDKTSPWPVVVVLGIVLSEVGILFNLYPVSVTGLLLFAGSVAGIVHEVASQVDGGVSAFLAAATLENGVVQRGYTIAATGALATLGGLLAPRAPNQ